MLRNVPTSSGVPANIESVAAYGARLVSKLSPPTVPFRGCMLFVGGPP